MAAASAASAVMALVLAGCSGAAGPPASTSTTSTTTPSTSNSIATGSGVSRWPGTPVSPKALPLGDGKVSTSARVGYVDSCVTQFNGGGAREEGPWIDAGAGTWDSTTKLHVEGAHAWPSASHSFTVSGSQRVLVTNGLPTGATTGTFPIAASDPAHQYDANPNSISAQSFRWTLPAEPQAAASPTCLGLGVIGVTTDGVALFDSLDAAGRDAGAHELQDSCDGHPQQQGVYHYHTYSVCLATAASNVAGSSSLVGYALDGYGIFLERDAAGNLPTDADLDACHGRTSAVAWDGKTTVMYHYDITAEYPYTLGCFHGTPVTTGPPGP